ncbi:MAG: Hsp70 family protein, partial [Candidatus Bathyarchaeia archaeon]
DPMECVAMGAAIQAAVLTGEVKDILLLDVTPLSLGVETLGAVMTKLIERNTTIPTRKSQIFTTAADFQTAVTIHVLQGERSMATDNLSLGQFNLTEIPPAPRGVPQIEVSFDIDANGILSVSAKDLATNKEQKITITASKRLSEDEIKRMVRQAEEYAEQDKKKREEAEIRNQADSLIYAAEKTKADLKDKISKEKLEALDASVKDLKEALESKDIDKIKANNEKLAQVVQEIGAQVYQEAAQRQAQAQGPPPGGAQQAQQQQQGPSEASRSNVVDADYERVDKGES